MNQQSTNDARDTGYMAHVLKRGHNPNHHSAVKTAPSKAPTVYENISSQERPDSDQHTRFMHIGSSAPRSTSDQLTARSKLMAYMRGGN